jgi:hypothetical protein
VDSCDAYRHFAAKCVELARRMESTRDRLIMLEMALLWSRLAEYAAKTVARKESAENGPPRLTATLSTLGEGQKSESARRDARGGGGLG